MNYLQHHSQQTGPHSGILFRITATIEGRTVTCLIDCGATNDFISNKFINENNIRQQTRKNRKKSKGI